jgi:hypothetical protein
VWKSEEKHAVQFVRMSNILRTQKGRAGADLRAFESISIYFSEEEMEELQVAIDERRSWKLARSVRMWSYPCS